MTSYSALAARCEATGIASFFYSLLRAALLTINGIVGEIAIFRQQPDSFRLPTNRPEREADMMFIRTDWEVKRTSSSTNPRTRMIWCRPSDHGVQCTLRGDSNRKTSSNLAAKGESPLWRR
jgi:hypothetical protein